MCRPSLEQSRAKYKENLGSDMNISVFEDIISHSYSYDFGNIMLCWVGEPLMHPDFMNMIEILKKYDQKRNFFDVLTFNTNGVFFNKKKINEFFDIIRNWNKKIAVVFSMDAFSKESFEKIKKYNLWEIVFENVKYFFEKKKELSLSGRLQGVVQFLVLDENKREALDFYDFFTSFFNERKMNWEMNFEMGFEYDNAIIFKEALLFPQEESHRIFEEAANRLNRLPKKKIFEEFEYKIPPHKGIERLKFYSERKEKLHKYSNRPPCISPFMYPTVHVDGRVTVCCRDNSLELVIGNLVKQDFKDIWEGERANKLRNAHLTSNLSDYPLCFFCENYTEYFFNDEIVGKKYKYQEKPKLFSEKDYYDAIESIFYKKPDISMAGMLQDYCEKHGEIERIENIYSFLHESSDDDKATEILASLKFKSGKFHEVIELLSDKKLNFDTEKLLAQSFEAIGEDEKACDLYEKIVKQNKDIHLLKSLAGIYNRLEKREKLIEILKSIIAQETDEKEEYSNYFVQLLLLEGDYITAWEKINNVINDQNMKSLLLKRMANEMMESKNYENALFFINKIYETSKDQEFLANAAERMLINDKVAFAEHILLSMDESFESLTLLWRLFQKTESNKADEIAERLCMIYNYKNACESVFFSEFDKKNWVKSLKLLRKLKKHWKKKDYEQKVADIFECSSKFLYAFNHLKKIRTKENFQRRISLLEKAGKWDVLENEYKIDNPEYIYEYYKPLIHYYINNGEKEKCHNILNKINSNGENIIEILGIYIKLKDYKNAYEFLKRIGKIKVKKEDESEFLKERALIYRKNRKFSKAIIDYLILFRFNGSRILALKNIVYLLINRK